jgi:perosamine synthetase
MKALTPPIAEKKYLAECIETGWISSESPFVKRLEVGFAKLMGGARTAWLCATGALP